MTLQRRLAIRRESSETSVPSMVSTCDAHGIPRKMYCYDCSLLACAECLLEKHTQHQYEYVRKVAAKYGKILEDYKPFLGEASQDYANAIAGVQNRRDQILQQTTQVCRTVNDAFDGVQRLLEETRDELLRKAGEITELKLSSLHDQEQQIARSLDSLNRVAALVEAFTTEPSKGEEMISSFQDIAASVERQKEMLLTMCLVPLEIPDLEANVACAHRIREICHAHPPQVFASTTYRPGTSTTEVGSPESLLIRSVTQNPSIDVTLKSLNGQFTVVASVTKKGCRLYEAVYRPASRGRYVLSVEVEGRHVPCSPWPLFVSMPPSLIGRPVRVLVGDISTPTGVAFNSRGEMVVTEWEANVVSVRDRQGKRLFELRGHTCEHPFGVALDGDDNIYVSEEAANRISKFARDGVFLKSVGTRGTEPGQFQSPRGLRVINDKLYICDWANDRVQVFDKELQFQQCIVGDEKSFKWATDLTASNEGLLYIAGTDISDVQVICLGDYTTANSVHHITLLCPTGVCFDHTHRYLYVVDYNYHSVFVFTPDGNFVSKFGGEGSEEGQLMFPRGVAIDEDGYVYVCDTQNNRIQIF